MSLIPFDTVDILLCYDLIQPHELTITTYLKLNLHDKDLLQLHDTMLCEFNIGKYDCYFGVGFELAAMDGFVEVDQRVPMRVDIRLLVNSDGMHENFITLAVSIH